MTDLDGSPAFEFQEKLRGSVFRFLPLRYVFDVEASDLCVFPCKWRTKDSKVEFLGNRNFASLTHLLLSPLDFQSSCMQKPEPTRLFIEKEAKIYVTQRLSEHTRQ